MTPDARQAPRPPAGWPPAPGVPSPRACGSSPAHVCCGRRCLRWPISMFGLGAVNVLFLPLVVDVLQVNPVWLGGIELAQSVSMILAAGIVAMLAARLRPTTIVSVAPRGGGRAGRPHRGCHQRLPGHPAAVRHRLVHHPAAGVGRDAHADRRARCGARPGDVDAAGRDGRGEHRFDALAGAFGDLHRHPRGVLRRRGDRDRWRDPVRRPVSPGVQPEAGAKPDVVSGFEESMAA